MIWNLLTIALVNLGVGTPVDAAPALFHLSSATATPTTTCWDPPPDTPRQLRDCLIAEYGVVDDPERTRSLLGIVDRIEEASGHPGLDLELTYLDAPTVNAFTMPGGYVIVFRGLVEIADSVAGDRAPNDPAARRALAEGYVAAVIAHEVAHNTLGHTGGLAALMSGENDNSDASNPDRPAFVDQDPGLRSLAYSREDEFAADRTGALYLLRAGWEIQHAMDLWRAMGERARGDEDAFTSLDALTYVNTHPRPSAREAELEIFRGELKRNQQRFDDALSLIRHNVELGHAIALLDRVLQDFPNMLAAHHARATALHLSWLNSVPVEVQQLRSDLVTPGNYFLPGIRGADESARMRAAAREEYEWILSREMLPHSLSHLALLDAYAGDLARAEQRARRAAELARDEPAIQNNLGVVLYLAGEIQQARRIFEAVLERSGDDLRLPLLFNLGKTLAELGSPEAESLLGLYVRADAAEGSPWRTEAIELLGRDADGSVAIEKPGAPEPVSGSTRPAPSAPAIAGVRLGASQGEVVAALGQPDAQEGKNGELWAYHDPGLMLALPFDAGVKMILLIRREAGEVEGIRVGDPFEPVSKRLGASDLYNGEVWFYDRGVWVLSIGEEDGVINGIGISANE